MLNGSPTAVRPRVTKAGGAPLCRTPTRSGSSAPYPAGSTRAEIRSRSRGAAARAWPGGITSSLHRDACRCSRAEMMVAVPVRDLLRRRDVTPLLLASVVGRLPLGMVPLALVLFARRDGGDYATAGAWSLGLAAGTPLLGRALDRRGL